MGFPSSLSSVYDFSLFDITGLSCADIATKITAEGYKISVRTVENIVADAKLPRLPRRTQAERGLS